MPQEYLALAAERAALASGRYKQPEDFGYDFRQWVSPYTKGAHRLGGLMLVLQDWASEDGLSGGPDPQIQQFGRSPNLRTNTTLEAVLRKVLNLSLSDVYATNAFPFVKLGGMSRGLRRSDVFEAAHRFLRREIALAQPTQIFALGAVPRLALEELDVDCLRLPHPAARIGSVDAHECAWRVAISEYVPARHLRARHTA